MNLDLHTYIRDISLRLEQMRVSDADGTEEPARIKGRLFEEMISSLEELQVADEALRGQAEALAVAQAQIESERQRYRDLFEFAPDGYLVTDAGGTIREANQAASVLLNLSGQFLPGRPITVFVVEEHRRAFRDALAQIATLGGNRISHWEVPMLRRRAASFIASVTIGTVRDADMRVVGLRWMIRDISGRRQLDSELLALNESLEQRIGERMADLQASEERFHLAATAARAIIYDWDVVTGATQISHGMSEVLGYERSGPSVFDNRFWQALVHPDDLPGAIAAVSAAIGDDSQTYFVVSYRVRTSDGDYLDVEDHGYVLRDAVTGRALRVVGSTVDVSEKKRATAALEAAEERLRLMVEGARDYALFMFDPSGEIFAWSSGAERVFGWTEQEMMGRSAAVIFRSEDIAAGIPEQEMARARSTGRAEDNRWHVRKDGSEFWAEGVLTALRDGDDGGLRGYAKVLRDATERRQAQEVLQQAYERERRIAVALQDALLHSVPEDHFPGIRVATRYEAALDEALVGGDFFDTFALDGGRIALVVGDASGKGLDAAVRTGEVKSALRAFVRSADGDGQGDLAAMLRRVNRFVCDAERFAERLDDTFVALTLVIVDPARDEARYCVAGMEPPFFIAADGAVRSLDATGLPLGVLAEEPYDFGVTPFRSGDTLLLFTDGLTEARAGGELFGYDRLRGVAGELARSIGSAPLANAAADIVKTAKTFATDGRLSDDVCLLLARRV